MERRFFLYILQRTAWPAALLGTTGPSGAQADESLTRIQKRGRVLVANTQTSPPWSFLGPDNQPTGYDVAIAREIFGRIGIARVEFVADSFKNFIEGLKAGKYDVVVNSMARTAERARVVDFTEPYTVQDFRIWVHARNTDITGPASLAGKSVGASAGTSNELWARNNLPRSEVRVYEGGGFLYNDLVNGRLDSVIDSYFNGHKMQSINNLPVKPVGEPLVYSLGAAAVPKNSPALLAAMNKAIADMLADGTIQKLAHQYVSADYDMVGNMKKGQAWK
ncbi:transporter substrate-binding domain-containing protein [Xylophilus sp.]|uniref:transporter substrate-binding domain-containing protein n=1 Tax=Xylophilus sp. TaxID=2653893 RepID=UPI0013BCD73B|nr:transporter substrate-binding domain-containing protein [Xylophilus sp.]KAF1049827.1 MAG: L-cystine-binding protein FliY [Xylophilus sp.]